MIAHLSFDTLGFVKRLAAAGMDTSQAEALAEALNEMMFDTLATKSDLRDLEQRLRAEMKELELRLTNSLTLRMGAMNAATIAILGTLITLN